MAYGKSFSALSPVDLLRFAKSEADAALGVDGNAWIRLIEVSSAKMKRSDTAESRDIFAKVATIALEGARSRAVLPDERWAMLALKFHVDRTLLPGLSDSERLASSAAAYEIFLGQLNNISNESNDLTHVKRLAIRLGRISRYLGPDQILTIEQWIPVGPNPSG